MKKISIILIFIFLLITAGFSQSVILKGVINLKQKKAGKMSGFLFGKKKKVPARPCSVFRIDNKLFGITDQVNGFVGIYTNEGDVKKKIFKYDGNSFVSPVSGSPDGRGGFVISDSSLKVVVSFSSDLKFSKILISDEKLRITGVYIFGERIYATDTGNHNIKVFDMNGKGLLTFGKRGSGPGEFNYPTHLFVNSKFIYVTDAMNFRVQVFDHDGNFVRKFGKIGKRGGDFSKPKGIAVDEKGRIFVTDVNFDNIQIFDRNGKFLSYYGGPGNVPGKFWMPSGIIISNNHDIYVSDTYNSRIQILKISMEN